MCCAVLRCAVLFDSSVFKARPTGAPESKPFSLAVKVISLTNPQWPAERVRREAEIVSVLRHRGIVAYKHHFGECGKCRVCLLRELGHLT